MIQSLQISNYKSIRELNLECARINVFIGEPNVGKSNILEALDLTYLPSLFTTNEQATTQDAINIKRYFRAEDVASLFHLGEVSRPISVRHPGFSYDISLKLTSNNRFELENSNGSLTVFNNSFQPAEGTGYHGSPVKPYRYLGDVHFHDAGNYINVLMPPYGNNLPTVIQHNPSFLKEVGNLLLDYGCELNIDRHNNNLIVQMRISKGVVYTVPWEAIAETLKRYIFYTAAIEYNNAHVVTLEEPEVHSFPKYISSLADKIIQTTNRQFFIATHSPYLLNNLIENTETKDLAVFVCGYNKQQYETTAKKLSEEDLSELLNYGVDIFFNINRYADDRIEHNS